MSFSVLYEKRSLDIVCKDRKEFDTWTKGLEVGCVPCTLVMPYLLFLVLLLFVFVNRVGVKRSFILSQLVRGEPSACFISVCCNVRMFVHGALESHGLAYGCFIPRLSLLVLTIERLSTSIWPGRAIKTTRSRCVQ